MDEQKIKDTDVVPLGTQLKDKKIALIVSGGIAAYKAPSLARHYRQYGADITIYPTDNALDFIGPLSLEWASQNEIITKLTKNSEHLYPYDAYVVAPATLNIIGDIATGKAQDAARATLASAFGKIQEDKDTKLMIAPTMHNYLYNNPALQDNLTYLKSKGVNIIEPNMKNNKANLEETHTIVASTIRELSKDPLKGKNILLNAGSTFSKVDNVRGIGNIFRGALGLEIAEDLFLRGANVKLIYGNARGLPIPAYIDSIKVTYFEDMYNSILTELKTNNYDAGIFSAAINDGIPEQSFEGKIKTDDLNIIRLKPAPKIIKTVRENHSDFPMVTFKLESNITIEDLKAIGSERLNDYEIVVVNRLEDMNKDQHTSYIMGRDTNTIKTKTKKETTEQLLNALGNYLLSNKTV